MFKRVSLGTMAVFYLLAGINHFRKPDAYYKIIPPYFPDVHLINILAGVAEMLLAVLLLFPSTRKYACYGIILMLIAFIPAHIYMLKVGFCVMGHCAPVWALWLRLLFLQPLLILWAWRNRN